MKGSVDWSRLRHRQALPDADCLLWVLLRRRGQNYLIRLQRVIAQLDVKNGSVSARHGHVCIHKSGWNRNCMFEFRIRCDGLNKEKIGAFERALLVRFGWAADFVQRWHSYQAHQGLPISFEPVRSNWAEAKRTECRRSKLLERLQDRQYAASILENQIAITNAQQNVKRTIASSNLNLFGSGKSIRNLGFQRERQPSILWQIVLVFEVNRRGDWALDALANQSDLRPGCFDGCGHLQNTAIFEANRSH